MLCRGTLADSIEFFNKLGARFECKDPEFLDPGDSFTFTGLDIERDVRGTEDWYYVSQISEVQEMLEDSGLIDVKEMQSPMPNKNKMLTL